MVGSIFLSSAYGIDVQPENDPYIQIVERGLLAMARAGNAGAYLVDSIIPLEYLPDWFPGARFKKDVKEWRQYVTAMPVLPFEYAKKSTVC